MHSTWMYECLQANMVTFMHLFMCSCLSSHIMAKIKESKTRSRLILLSLLTLIFIIIFQLMLLSAKLNFINHKLLFCQTLFFSLIIFFSVGPLCFSSFDFLFMYFQMKTKINVNGHKLKERCFFFIAGKCTMKGS